MKKSITIPSVKVTKEIVDQYFSISNVTHQTNVRIVGMDVWVDISYTDFLPIRKVRQDLEHLLPNAVIATIERDYSDSARIQAAAQFFATDEQLVYLKTADGNYQHVHPVLILEHILNDQDLTHLSSSPQE